jgi:hypothetical protein
MAAVVMLLSSGAHCPLDTWLWLNGTKILHCTEEDRESHLTTFARPFVTGQSGHDI